MKSANLKGEGLGQVNWGKMRFPENCGEEKTPEN